MSGALPFPGMSDSRSFISDHSRFHGGAGFLYAHEYDEQRRPAVAKLQPLYRQQSASSSRQPGPSSASVYYDPDVSPSYRDHYAPLSSPTYYASADALAYSSYAQPTRMADTPSIASHSSSSHSPPAPPEQPLSPLLDKPLHPFSPSRSSQKRREKPRIELAPDQPLTTQGKPRARVYVACVQCRGRKIRCDGAKPACHNCSRRTTNGAEPLQPCTYDAAPKRRGPDKHPGCRQRLSAQEMSEGGKVRRRRRRDPASADEQIPMAAHVPSTTPPSTASSLSQPLMRQMRAQGAIASPVDVLARGTLDGSSHVMGKPELYHGAQQPGVAPPTVMSHGASSQMPSMESLSHPSNAMQRILPVNEPHFPQVHTQVSPAQDYTRLSGVQELTYVGYLPVSAPTVACITEFDEYDEENERKPVIGAEPSMQFARETWWDSLLGLYASHQPQLSGGNLLTPGLRDAVSQHIWGDLRFLFSASNYWFSFVNIPRFFSRVHDANTRTRLQPSLILAALAVANLIRSSERENGAKGRAWALALRDAAQGALDASLNSRWIDEYLVQASWLIAFFEISAHPLHSALRVRSALSVLDSLVRTLAMCSLDRNDHRVSVFTARSVPTVVTTTPCSSPINPWIPHMSQQALPGGSVQRDCACSAYTLGNNWEQAQQLTPLWLMTPAWNRDQSDAEARREESRRLVWSCAMLTAGYTSFTSANNSLPPLDLFLMEPSNYALLFPGESLAPLSPRPASKDTVWALYMRTMLLWHSCIRMRGNTGIGDAEKAQFAVSAWLEMDKIEEALNSHTCGIERAFLFQGREYLFNSRMCISYEFQRYIPHATANANLIFHRGKAEEWLTHQANVAKQTVYGLQSITGQPNVNLERRPFFIFWFMSQVTRALSLWKCDGSLTVALDVSKALLGPIEYMMTLWPCPDQLKRHQILRDELTQACLVAGLSPPGPMNLSLDHLKT